MRGPQRRQHLPAHVGRLPYGKGAEVATTSSTEGYRDQLHDDPRPAVLLDHVVDRDDGGVVQPCRHARLAGGAEQLPFLVGPGQSRGQEHFLNGDLPVEQCVAAFPDHAHTAAPQFAQELVALGDQPVAIRNHVQPL